MRDLFLFLVRWLVLVFLGFAAYLSQNALLWPLPAILFYGVIGVAFLWRYPGSSEMLVYVDAALIVLLSFVLKNDYYLWFLMVPLISTVGGGLRPLIVTFGLSFLALGFYYLSHPVNLVRFVTVSSAALIVFFTGMEKDSAGAKKSGFKSEEDDNRAMRRLVLERDEATENLYNKIRQHSTLFEIMCLITGSLETEDILRLTVKRTKEELGAHIGFLMLVEDGVLRVRHSDGLYELAAEAFQSEVGEYPFGRLVESGESLCIKRDDGKHPVFEALKSLDQTDRVRDLLVVPLRSPSMKLPARGVLGVANSLDGTGFGKDQAEMIVILAGQAAIAMENAERVGREKSFLKETIGALAAAVNQKHKYTHVMHSKSVAKWAVDIAREMNLPPEEIEIVEIGALLHDIGKIAIPDYVLTKPDNLTHEEKEIMSRHPEYGAEILKGVTMVQNIVPYVLYHHERWDGSGYPAHLKEDQIPLGVQIVSLADTFDALTARRPYHEPMPFDEAIATIKRESGKHFGPKVVEGFLSVMAKRSQDVRR